MMPCDPHSDYPDEVMGICEQVSAFVSSWAWAATNSDVGGNLSGLELEGLARITGWVEHMLSECQRHMMKQCDFFKKPEGA